jgi:hypothetical protein
MSYLIGGIIGGMFVGLWAYARCRYYREFVELKKSEFKSILNYYNRLEAAINRIGNINEARLRVEAEAAGANNIFGGTILSRKSRADDIADALGRMATAVEAKAKEDKKPVERLCRNCKYGDGTMENPPCYNCNHFSKWEPREGGE